MCHDWLQCWSQVWSTITITITTTTVATTTTSTSANATTNYTGELEIKKKKEGLSKQITNEAKIIKEDMKGSGLCGLCKLFESTNSEWPTWGGVPLYYIPQRTNPKHKND